MHYVNALYNTKSYQDQELSVVDVTHASVQSGDWSNPVTWAGGIVPTADARVRICMGHVVSVDGIIAEELATIRVDGTLRFHTGVDTELSVDTIVGTGAHMMTSSSVIEMGTVADPIAADVSARIIIVDHNGGLDSAESYI